MSLAFRVLKPRRRRVPARSIVCLNISAIQHWARLRPHPDAQPNAQLNGGDMFAAAAADPSHPAVAALLGLGAAGLAGAVVAMVWNVHTRQIRLAERLARRQVLVIPDAGTPGQHGSPAGEQAGRGNGTAAGSGPAAPANGTASPGN